MKYECEVIQDLLPLYKDGVCSEETTKVVEEHLSECPKCTEFLNELKDTVIDSIILKEKETVIESQSKFFKRKSALIGSIIAAVFAIPILVCLIVNLASGHALSWFFIVLAAMLIPTSLFVVPLLAPKNRMFLTMVSFTASVIALLAVCCIYSGGRWFLVAASATFFGLTMCFAPFIACRRPVNTYLGDKKGLAVMTAYTVTFFLMMVCIGLHVKSVSYFPMAFSISVPIVAFVWLMFLIIRYLPFNGLVKTGVCIAAVSLFCYFGSRAITFLTLATVNTQEVMVYTEPDITFVVGGIVIGAIFALVGFIKGNIKEEKKNG